MTLVFILLQNKYKGERHKSHDVASYVTSFVVFGTFSRFYVTCNTSQYHCFVRQLYTFLPKEHTYIHGYCRWSVVNNQTQRQ